jgi:hypothetical protein
MKKIIIFLIIIIGISEGCKKYEDGPCISFRSPLKRLYGTYTLEKYTVNGEDSLSSLYDSLSLTFQFYYQEDNGEYICLNDRERKDGLYCFLIWTWELTNNDKILKITSSSCAYSTGPFKTDVTPEWEILKLKNNHIHLKTLYNNKEYYLEFGPFKNT